MSKDESSRKQRERVDNQGKQIETHHRQKEEKKRREMPLHTYPNGQAWDGTDVDAPRVKCPIP